VVDVTTAGSLLLGLFLRVGLPLGVTSVAVALLWRLDAGWQAEAAQATGRLAAPVSGLPCWEQLGCSIEQRRTCPAFLQPDQPCWQHFRGPEGNLRTSCLACPVFREAPVLAPIDASDLSPGWPAL
jgi:hypothetical protein